MKTDRLIGILSILLQEEKTTAPELAEKFEGSRRTINRDIEDLCKAGIPIRTAQGTGGGISIMDGYRMDRTILTSKDMQMILAGLRSLDSVSGNRYYGQLMEKIQTGSSEFISERDSMLIDLSSWYKGSLVPKIEVIQNAIENRHTIQFKYYAPSGDGNRRIEPYYLVFRWSSWYVWGWCLEREDYRLFKLNRMDCVTESEQFFMCRNVPMPNLSNEKIFPGGIKVKVLFAPDVKWRLVEEFGPHCFTRTDDVLMLAAPVSFEGRLEQYVGRLNRDYVGKEAVYVYDYIDSHVRYFDKMYAKRLRTYRKTGFSIWTQELQPKQIINAIFDSVNYTEKFEQDIVESEKMVVISSPDIRQDKIDRFLLLITKRQEVGVKVTVITTDPEDITYGKSDVCYELIRAMQLVGINVITRTEVEECFAIIDDEIVWHGGMNLLGKADVWDNLMRIRNSQVATELLEIALGCSEERRKSE